MQRKSEGTLVIAGHRFEVPDRYRHLTQLEVRYASWDLSHVHLVDECSGTVLYRLFPQDKAQNASGLCRTRDPDATATTASLGHEQDLNVKQVTRHWLPVPLPAISYSVREGELGSATHSPPHSLVRPQRSHSLAPAALSKAPARAAAATRWRDSASRRPCP
jgi:hypothetical protein